jgi:hypothetical protein
MVGHVHGAVGAGGEGAELQDRRNGAIVDAAVPVADQAAAVGVRGEERPVVAGGDAGDGLHRVEAVGLR